MDILPADVLDIIETAFKVLFLTIGGMVILISFFQTKEARKMEKKLRIALPGSVGLAISVQLVLSAVFLFIVMAFLLFP